MATYTLLSTCRADDKSDYWSEIKANFNFPIFRGNGDGSKVEMLSINLSLKSALNNIGNRDLFVLINTIGQNCGGQLEGIAKQSGAANHYVVSVDSGRGTCEAEITFGPKMQSATIVEGVGCLSLHGPSCEFSSSLQRIPSDVKHN